MTLKEQIQAHIEKKYNETRWPNIYVAEVVRLFGPNTVEALNELCNEGIIRPGNGANGKLIIYNADPQEREYSKQQYANSIKR